jgi:uncharacterized membrane protein YsdA (DUF1294 family)
MSHRTFIRGTLAVLLIGAAAAMVALWYRGLPLWAAYLAGIGLVTFLGYGVDKRQARAKRTRLPEVVLHGCALIGGSPGAWLGQIVFRHKTVKPSFRRVFWGIVVLQCLGLGLWFYYRK